MNDEAPETANPASTVRRGARSWWVVPAAMLAPPALMVLVARVVARDDDTLVWVVFGAGGTSAFFSAIWLSRRFFAERGMPVQILMAVVFSAVLCLASAVLCFVGWLLGGGEFRLGH